MYDDQPISYLDRCACEGICPRCNDEHHDCRCDEDAEEEQVYVRSTTPEW